MLAGRDRRETQFVIEGPGIGKFRDRIDDRPIAAIQREFGLPYGAERVGGMPSDDVVRGCEFRDCGRRVVDGERVALFGDFQRIRRRVLRSIRNGDAKLVFAVGKSGRIERKILLVYLTPEQSPVVFL